MRRGFGGTAACEDLSAQDRAVTGLYAQHAGWLTRLASRLGAGDEAEDVVAEVFCELHRRWAELRDEKAAAAWLRSAVANQVRMRIRHQQVVRRHSQLTRDESCVPGPEALVMQREDRVQLIAALLGLPPRQREALVLRYWLDLREAEVAGAMGISPGSVKVHTSRAMTAMVAALVPVESVG